MSQNPGPLDPHLKNLHADITTLGDDLRWAHADAWWPTATDPLAPSRPSTTIEPQPDDDPDHVEAPRYALGVGDDTTRQALVDVTTHLRTIELRLAAAVFHAGIRHRQPPLHQPGPTSTLDHLEKTIDSCHWRLTALAEDAHQLDRHTRTIVRKQLHQAATTSSTAARRLSSALNRGETGGVAHAEPKCRICGIRPMAMREHQIRHPDGTRRTGKRPSQGRRCDTCATWFRRNGNERPVSLDADAVDEALAAAGRRRARGEGWGSA